jgi:hypothetical protein
MDKTPKMRERRKERERERERITQKNTNCNAPESQWEGRCSELTRRK